MRLLEEKTACIRLRKEGLSATAISLRLGIPKRTIHCWVRDTLLTPEQIKNLRKRSAKHLQEYWSIRDRKGNSGRSISPLRKEMGEEAWIQFQKQKNRGKMRRWWDKSTKSKAEYHALRRLNFKKKLVEHKGGCCEVCGYSKCLAALDFHHKDNTTKEFVVSSKSLSNLEKIKKEVDKCALLCRNCHTELHYNRSVDNRNSVHDPVAK